MKKITILIMSLILTVSLVACNVERIGEDEEADLGKTQLYIGNFDGGYGEEWLELAKTRFEEKYKDVSFEEGKKGVQVIIRSSKNYVGVNLQTEIDGLQQDIFFTESVYYYDFVNQGLLLDITDVVENPLNEEFIEGVENNNESTSIEDKMREGHTSFLKTPDGKYYGLPFYEANYAMIYDVDLFNDELLYVAKEGTGNSFGFVTSLDAERSAGPDGDYTTTYDNGLPATYEEFYQLADYMVRKNIVPLTWAGNVQNYVSSLLTSFWADFEGSEQMMLNYTFDGTANNIVTGFDNNGNPITESKEINLNNGYLTYASQLGRYHALSFLENILNEPTYYNSSLVFSPAQTHRDAQDSFLSGKYITNNETIGMLIDGTWWQNEAGGVFDALVQAYGEDASMDNRNFAVMPIPKVDEDHLGTYTVYEANFSMALANANVETWKIPLVKAFMQFVHTNESLVEFSKTTNTFRPFAYDMTEEDINDLTYWGQSLYHLHENADYVTPYAYNTVYLKNISTYANEITIWNTMVNNNTLYNIPTTALFNEDDVTARSYFEGLSYFWTQSYWEDRV